MAHVNPEAELALTAVSRVDAAPPDEQVAAAIRRAINDGEAGPGDRIPRARDLATVCRGRTIRVTGTRNEAPSSPERETSSNRRADAAMATTR